VSLTGDRKVHGPGLLRVVLRCMRLCEATGGVSSPGAAARPHQARSRHPARTCAPRMPTSASAKQVPLDGSTIRASSLGDCVYGEKMASDPSPALPQAEPHRRPTTRRAGRGRRCTRVRPRVHGKSSEEMLSRVNPPAGGVEGHLIVGLNAQATLKPGHGRRSFFSFFSASSVGCGLVDLWCRSAATRLHPVEAGVRETLVEGISGTGWRTGRRRWLRGRQVAGLNILQICSCLCPVFTNRDPIICI
jgi:hypothetical protein